MAAVFDSPVTADVTLHLFGSLLFQTAHVVAPLAPGLTIAGSALALHHDDAFQSLPCRAYVAVHPVEPVADDGLAFLHAPVRTAFTLVVGVSVAVRIADFREDFKSFGKVAAVVDLVWVPRHPGTIEYPYVAYTDDRSYPISCLPCVGTLYFPLFPPNLPGIA